MPTGSAMRIGARLYIATVLTAGCALFVRAMSEWTCRHPLHFVCTLGIAMIASGLKVLLPGINGNMSVSYFFVLLSIMDFSLPETVVLGCLSMVVQTFWRPRHRAKVLHLLFNLASSSIAVSGGYAAYRAVLSRGNALLSITAAATTYYFLSCIVVALVVTLTESKSLRYVWREYYLWTFPYYMVGGLIAGAMSACTQRFGWETSITAWPVVYVVFRSYRLYLGRLESEKRHAQDMAALHLRTIEALALAIEAKDDTTRDHLQRVQIYAEELGKKVGLEESQMRALRTASILHDIGKLAVPEHIISKPG